MYEQINKRGRRKRDYQIWVGLVISVALMLAVIIPVIIGGRAQYHYHKLFQEMAHSSVYSRYHTGARLYVGDEKYFFSPERTSGLFTLLADGGSGKPQSEKKLPDTEYVLIEFGDGATLQIWYAKVKGNYGGPLEDGLFISYVNPDGERMSYTTSQIYAKELIPYLAPEAQDWLDRGIAQMDPER